MNINLKNKLLAQCGLHFNLLCVTYEIEMGIISTQLQIVDIQTSVTFLQDNSGAHILKPKHHTLKHAVQ